ncbi:bacteriocin [Clostridium cellulovorans]|nr:bacteriocin [Clostridium cellulovorans]
MDNFSPLTKTQLNEINGGWSLRKALKKIIDAIVKRPPGQEL